MRYTFSRAGHVADILWDYEHGRTPYDRAMSDLLCQGVTEEMAKKKLAKIVPKPNDGSVA